MDSTLTPLPLQPNSTNGFNINTIAFTTKPRVQHCAEELALIREMAIDATQKPVVGLRHH
jgi:hypothetical protein